MNSEGFLFLANHLWQSTLLAAGVWLMTLVLRNNRAAVRHRLWFAASIKFLIPFSLLVSIGTHVQWPRVPTQPVLISQIAAPFVPASVTPVQPVSSSGVPEILAVVWILGVIVNLGWWLSGWLRLRGIIRRASPLHLDIPVSVKTCGERLEPGVSGIFRPVLLLPAGIRDQLSPPQFQTIIAHELTHVRRRDNLFVAVHLCIESLFWFHPLLWWIKSRLIAEQERACDEEVLRLGNDPHVYAESILKLCELYITSPLIRVAGVTGANLKKRIEEIMNNRVANGLSPTKCLMLATVGILTLVVPVMIGAVGTNGAPPPESKKLAEAKSPQAPSVRNETVAPAIYLSGLGTVVASNTVTIKSRLDGELLSVDFKEGETVHAGQLLASIDASAVELQLADAARQLASDQSALAEARSRQDSSVMAQLGNKIAADQASVESANLQLAYSEIRSPIAGVAGLRLTDPGNIVHAADSTGIVVIAQLQPITVVFTLPEDNLQLVLARLRSGRGIPVEAWSRDDAQKLATGWLVAVDNQIDQTTGTVKLKALFDNTDNALFPNQFVNVRLMANVR